MRLEASRGYKREDRRVDPTHRMASTPASVAESPTLARITAPRAIHLGQVARTSGRASATPASDKGPV